MIYLIEEIEGLTHFQKISLMNRYVSVMEEFEGRSSMYAILFYIGHITVTVGSLLVPALLSIQYTGSTVAGDITMYVYWVTWILSLMVTMWNGILTFFKVDKKYYFLMTSLEQLRSEVSQYINLSGRYGGHYTKGKSPTHANQLVFICHNIEKIKLKQVQEEYFKVLESLEEHHAPGQAPVPPGGIQQNMVAGMFNPTPTQAQLQEHQAVLARALLPTTQVDGGTGVPKDQGQTQIQNQTSPTNDGSQFRIQVQAENMASPSTSILSDDEESVARARPPTAEQKSVYSSTLA